MKQTRTGPATTRCWTSKLWAPGFTEGAFADWLIAAKNPLDIVFRLADEAGVVLLPGKGFGTPHPSARVSPANLNETDYVRIGLTLRSVLAEYADE